MTKQYYTNKSTIVTILLFSGIFGFISVFYRMFHRMLLMYPNSTITLKGLKLSVNGEKLPGFVFDYFVFNDFILQWTIPIILIGIVAMVQKWNLKHFFGFQNLNFKKNLGFYIGSMTIVILVGLILNIDGEASESSMTKLVNQTPLIYVIVWFGLIIPLMEEVIFRRLIYDFSNMLINRLAPYIGMLVSFLLFTILHSQYEGAQLFQIAVLSGLLSFGRYYSKGLIIPILIHISNNLLGILL